MQRTPTVSKLSAPNGHTVTLEVFEGDQTVLTHYDARGNILSRTCSGKCGDQQVGPIDCPEGTSPHLNCVVDPPTLACVKD